MTGMSKVNDIRCLDEDRQCWRKQRHTDSHRVVPQPSELLLCGHASRDPRLVVPKHALSLFDDPRKDVRVKVGSA